MKPGEQYEGPRPMNKAVYNADEAIPGVADGGSLYYCGHRHATFAEAQACPDRGPMRTNMQTQENDMAFRDLGLTYPQAAHGIQTAIAYRMSHNNGDTEPKHLRTGIDLSKTDQAGLAALLIAKGVFTEEEYVEYLRLAANEEVAKEEEEAGGRVSFR